MKMLLLITVKPHHLCTYEWSEGVQMINAQMANLITYEENYAWAATQNAPPKKVCW